MSLERDHGEPSGAWEGRSCRKSLMSHDNGLIYLWGGGGGMFGVGGHDVT